MTDEEEEEMMPTSNSINDAIAQLIASREKVDNVIDEDEDEEEDVTPLDDICDSPNYSDNRVFIPTVCKASVLLSMLLVGGIYTVHLMREYPWSVL